MKIAPGMMLMICGLVLVAVGVWAHWGWESAALVTGGLMVAIGIFTLPEDTEGVA